jgi:hypothetical protein
MINNKLDLTPSVVSLPHLGHFLEYLTPFCSLESFLSISTPFFSNLNISLEALV